jgi:hypothetical protein
MASGLAQQHAEQVQGIEIPFICGQNAATDVLGFAVVTTLLECQCLAKERVQTSVTENRQMGTVPIISP